MAMRNMSSTIACRPCASMSRSRQAASEHMLQMCLTRTFYGSTLVQRQNDKSPYPSFAKDLQAISERSRRPLERPRPFKSPAFVSPQKDLPFFKFSELLERRFVYLSIGSKKIDEIIEEFAIPTKKRSIVNEYKEGVFSQPPSTYTGQAPTLHSSKMWQPRSEIPTFPELKAAYEKGDNKGLDELLISKFALFASMRRLSNDQIHMQKQLADMTRPADWYPLARAITRELHLHVGPTNSGKTYHALQRLKQAKSGTFAGPLRLLAHEVYDRLNKEGIPCNLSTGEEKRYDPTVQLTASTIEMLNLDVEVDVMVIDEIQMIADPERGSAWTSALLGAPAKEIHMCGEASVVDLVTKIAKSMGETVIVHEYHRLGGLEPLEQSLDGTFRDVREGDAVVTFSRADIFNVKKRIEESTGFKCAVVYGALPPETRAQQAALFNDPESDYKVIVASDAIGMGLNLSIKRVIFESVEKFNGEKVVKLPIPQVKQIAGRAGRFKSKAKVDVNDLDPPKDEPGYVTTLRDGDLKYLHEALATPTIQVQKAYLRPPLELVESFARPYAEGFKMSIILGQLRAFARLGDLYALQSLAQRDEVLDLLHPIKNLTIADRFTLVDGPLKTRIPGCVASFLELARALGDGTQAEILDLQKMNIDLLDQGVPTHPDGLRAIEELHAQLSLYMWLNLRYPGVFCSLEEVVQLKFATEEVITESLEAIKAKKKRNLAAAAAAAGGGGGGFKEQEYMNASMIFEQRRARANAWQRQRQTSFSSSSPASRGNGMYKSRAGQGQFSKKKSARA